MTWGNAVKLHVIGGLGGGVASLGARFLGAGPLGQILAGVVGGVAALKYFGGK